MNFKYGEVANAYQKRFDSFKYKVELSSTATVVEQNNKKEYSYLAEKMDLKNNRPEDFILLKSVLCTSLPYVNENGNAFRAEDLIKAVEDGQLGGVQPAIVDWKHDFTPMGNTIGAEIVDATVEVAGVEGKQPAKQIVVYSVFYSWLFPGAGEKIREWGEKGVLKFSMACGANDVERINGNTYVLVEPQFLANSIIPPDSSPADKNAGLISIASKNDNHNNTNGDLEMEKKLAELQKQVDALTASNKEYKEKLEKYEASEQAKQIEDMTAKIAALEKEVSDLKESKEAVVAEKETIATEKAEVEKKLEEAAKQVKEIREAEVKTINEERVTKMAELIENEDDLKFYTEKFQASLGEDNSIVDNADEYERFVALLSKEKDGVKPEDAPESDAVKASKKAGYTATKASSEKDDNLLDWA